MPQRIEPQPGQESVWDYPRPPRVEAVTKRIRVIFNGLTIADTTRAKRVVETSHPPVYYIPPEDVLMTSLKPTLGTSVCEWKGNAGYYDLVVEGRQSKRASWFYADPTLAFESIRSHIAFYASRVDECYVDAERVIPQPGDFYGGWVTADVVGPFKGESRQSMSW